MSNSEFFKSKLTTLISYEECFKKIWVYDIEEAQIGLPGLHNYRSLEPLSQYHKPNSLTKKLVKFCLAKKKRLVKFFSLALQNILKYKTFFYLHCVTATSNQFYSTFTPFP